MDFQLGVARECLFPLVDAVRGVDAEDEAELAREIICLRCGALC
jgi:hypothetical protein